jgi:hypothetical protein
MACGFADDGAAGLDARILATPSARIKDAEARAVFPRTISRTVGRRPRRLWYRARVKRSVAVFAVVCLVSALLLPTLALATDSGEHPGCSCPKGACHCAHDRERAGAGDSCSRAPRIETTGCGGRPSDDARLGPLLPDGEIAPPLALEAARGGNETPDRSGSRPPLLPRSVEPPPPKG